LVRNHLLEQRVNSENRSVDNQEHNHNAYASSGSSHASGALQQSLSFQYNRSQNKQQETSASSAYIQENYQGQQHRSHTQTNQETYNAQQPPSNASHASDGKISSNYSPLILHHNVETKKGSSNNTASDVGTAIAIDLTLDDDTQPAQHELNARASGKHFQDGVNGTGKGKTITGSERSFLESPEQKEGLQTPLCHGDVTFLRLQGIVTDEQLLNCDPHVLGFLYDKYRSTKGVFAVVQAKDIVDHWIKAALKTLGRTDCDEPSLTSSPHFPLKEIPDENDPPLMDNVQSLCKTTIDPETGFPRKTITSFDCANEILYEFVIDVRESTIPGAGLGAFLTYVGARTLKEGKQKKVGDITPACTRYLTEAVLPGSGNGLTVKISGKDIHGDEHLMGDVDGVGLWKQYSASEDFIQSNDNITFCSYEFGCGLLELGRYAPWLPSDRKTNLVFGIKDFLFSNEPSGWRFDVPEDLNGYEQVVDFTNDITGEPHKKARSHVTTYVNEVGHSKHLTENVLSRDDQRTVFYYVCLKKPIERGETVELLVDYSETYEDMRERKGYGKANIKNGVKSDSDSYTRIQRNMKERSEMEQFISSYTEKDTEQLLTYLREKVLDGIIAATLSSLPSSEVEGPVNKMDIEKRKYEIFLRQWVARRRLHWTASRIRSHAQMLFSRHGLSLESAGLCGPLEIVSEDPFTIGMAVFVNGWAPENDPRPPYSGLAIIDDMTELRNGRRTFTISFERHKSMKEVPEEVLTHPTESEFNSASRRYRAEMDKKKAAETLPKRVAMIHETLQRMTWNQNLNRIIMSSSENCNSDDTENKKSSLLGVMQQELSEELLYILFTEKKLMNPFDKSEWCPLSSMLLKRLLGDIARLSMLEDYGSFDSQKALAQVLYKRATYAAEVVKKIAKNIRDNNQLNDRISYLAFQEQQSGKKRKFICVFPSDRTIETFQGIDDCQCIYLDQIRSVHFCINVQWYIMRQIVSVVHSLASTISWCQNDLYSLQKMCASVGVDASLATAPLKRK